MGTHISQQTAQNSEVSIPYKRESTWELIEDILLELGPNVSIPYKRESTWELIDSMERTQKKQVSIPYKRESTWELIYKSL